MKRTLPTIPADRVIAATPSVPDEGVVSWNMNTTCNYRCSYCTQRFLDDRHRWANDVPAFLEAFGSLPTATGVPWEIKLSGGEPFLHPDFIDVVKGLVARDLYVSVVTNFSRDDDVIAAFVDAAGDHLRVLSCSLHLEFLPGDKLDRFIEKAAWTQAQLLSSSSSSSLVVTCVATQQTMPQLELLSQRFADVGVRFKVQPEKQDRDIVAYDDAGKALLYRLGGHNGTGNIAHDFGGQPCWSGARYFIVDDKGEAFRCYPARRYKVERLGNLLDGSFRLFHAARPCLYRSCHCTVPIARGMMPVAVGVDRFEE